MSTFVSTGHGCRMATTGSRGVTAVTSRRRSWHSLPSCYRASLPRRDERTGPQPLAARPLHVKRGRAFAVPPHSAAALVVQHYSPPRQAAPPAENTTGGHGCRSGCLRLPLSPPRVTTKPGHHPPKQRQEMVPLRSGPEDSRNSRDRGWDRAISSIRLSTHKASPPPCSAAIVAPPPGIKRV